MRLAVDIDNTILAFQEHWIDRYQLWFDREVHPAHAGTWDGLVTGTHFDGSEQFFDWFDRAHGWDTMPYMPGAAGGLFTLQQLGIPFFFVTARPLEGEASARELAKDWDTHVEFRNADSKHLASASIWIDDSPEVLHHLDANGKAAIRVIQPWNEGAPATFSAATWPEIIEILKEIQ